MFAMKLLVLLWWPPTLGIASSVTALELVQPLAMEVEPETQIIGVTQIDPSIAIEPESQLTQQSDSCSILSVKKPGAEGCGGDGGGSKATGSGAKSCLVCAEAGATVQWRGHFLHSGPCHSAARCHVRQVKLMGKETEHKDKALLDKNPEAYSSHLQLLKVAEGATRSPQILDAHWDTIKQVLYNDTYVDKQRLLLTKKRFIAYQKLWEGAESSDASSSFEARLEEQPDGEGQADWNRPGGGRGGGEGAQARGDAEAGARGGAR